MAHTKASGTTRLGRDSQSKRLGIKLANGQLAEAGNIIVRQRGTRFIPGEGAEIGKDDTIFAVRKGFVQFSTTQKTNYDGRRRQIKVVSIV